MERWPLLVCGIAGFLIAWSLIPLLQRHAALRRRGGGPRNFHHTHTNPIPRFGGAALIAAFVGVAIAAAAFLDFAPFSSLSTWGVLLGSLAMFALGLRDDFQPLGAKTKLAFQIVISAFVHLCGVHIAFLKNPLTGVVYELGSWGFVATVFWLVALTNLINLIDGIDGLAGGIALMLMCLLAYSGLEQNRYALFLAIGTAGALVGFLYYNFPPARIYMGDGGAYFLGFLIGALTITNSHKGTVAAALIAPIFALALPIADVLLAIARRGLKGLPIFRPDRKHIHHRLVEFGFTRRGAVLVLYGVSLALLALAFGAFWSRGHLVPILFGAMFLILFASARACGFFKDWHALGRELGISLQLRKESRYALALCQWLELEAERCESVQDLWTTYLFITRKLGLSHVKLVLDQGRHLSRQAPANRRAENEPLQTASFHRNRHAIPLANIQAIEFASESSSMSPRLFEHLTELAAESWMKALQRWETVHHEPAVFAPAVPSETTFFSRGRALISNAA